MARRTVQQQLERAEGRLALERAKLDTERARLEITATRQRRDALRKLAVHDAAKTDRRDQDWTKKNYSADTAVIADNPILFARARAAVRDNPHARSIVRSFRRNVVGRGMNWEPAARFKTSDAEIRGFNARIAELFTPWASNKLFCDAEGAKRLVGFEAQAVAELVTVGSYLVILETADNGPDQVPLRLRAVEAEQLDTVATRNPANGNAIKGGIEVDADNRPAAYWIYASTPSSSVSANSSVWSAPKSNRVAADRVLHLYQQDRPGQTTGVSSLASVLRKLRDSGEYDALEIWAARMQACMGLGIERPGGNEASEKLGLLQETGDTETDANDNPEVNWEPGLTFVGGPGEKLVFHTPNRPGGQYEPFFRAQLKAIAAGADLSYEQVARDFTGGNFSSQRQALLEDRRAWQPMQADIIADLDQPIYEAFAEAAVLAGLIDATSFFRQRTAHTAAVWTPDGWEWIDPARQAAAAKIALDYKIDTRDRLLRSQGRNVRDTFRQLEVETDLAADHGIDLPENAPAGPAVSPVEPRPAGAAAGPDADQDSPANDAISDAVAAAAVGPLL